MIKELERNLIKIASISGIILAASGLVFRAPDFGLGILLGTLVSIFNFRLLAKHVVNITKTTTPGILPLMGGYIFRFLLMGIILWMAINKSLSCFIGAAIGLFMIRLAIYVNEAIT